MTPTVLFIVLAAVVVVGTALAVAGRWQPQGLPAQAPSAQPGGVQPGPIEDGARFDVVLRGYRMEQVDAEIARLRAMLAAAPQAGPQAGPQAEPQAEPRDALQYGAGDEVQAGPGDPTIEG